MERRIEGLWLIWYDGAPEMAAASSCCMEEISLGVSPRGTTAAGTPTINLASRAR